MSVIKPTVGRKVWYHPSKHDVVGSVPMMTAGNDVPLDALIIAVWGDRMISVLVTDITGRQIPVLSVDLLQPGDEPRKDADGNVIGRYCEWMPDQNAQHAKQAELEAQVAVPQAVSGSAPSLVLNDGKDV